MSRRSEKARSPTARKPRKDTRPLRLAVSCFLFFAVGFSLAAGVSLALHTTGRRHTEPVSPEIPARQSKPLRSEQITPRRPERATTPDPQAKADAQVCFQKGRQHLQMERLADAFKEFSKASQLDPTAPDPYVGLAKVYEALDYDERAMEACRKAVEIDPKYHGARVALARLLSDFGKNEESLALLTDADKTNPNDPLVWAEMAVNRIRLGTPEKAIPLLERYNQARGKQAWGHAHLGRAHADAGELEAAEAAYRQALAIDPNMELGNLWLGQLLVVTGRKEQAAPRFKAFQRLRNLQTRQRKLEQAVARKPESTKAHVDVLVRLAHVRQLLGRPREAVTPLQKALQLEPDDPRLRKLYEDQLRRANVRVSP